MVTGKERAKLALNAVCPYYTMFPLDFPLRVVAAYSDHNAPILDPFCGRGTTNFAARIYGRESCGVDSSPVAVAVAKAKLAQASPARVVACARRILDEGRTDVPVPKGRFWELAFHSKTLRQICSLRAALLENCRSDTRILLRAILLGALHGPQNKHRQTYLSNQAPRTFAPKPQYAVKFWHERSLRPHAIDALEIVAIRAGWYLNGPQDSPRGRVLCGDSRDESLFDGRRRYGLVITSPPYYGMRTYLQDQWLRLWFLGGPEAVNYDASVNQLAHGSPNAFAEQLRRVWRNVASVCKRNARLVCRFGGIHDRQAEPADVIRKSFQSSGWRVQTMIAAGSATDGKRQATQFFNTIRSPRHEYDIYAALT